MSMNGCWKQAKSSSELSQPLDRKGLATDERHRCDPKAINGSFCKYLDAS
jgi:hypothetical protein